MLGHDLLCHYASYQQVGLGWSVIFVQKVSFSLAKGSLLNLGESALGVNARNPASGICTKLLQELVPLSWQLSGPYWIRQVEESYESYWQ